MLIFIQMEKPNEEKRGILESRVEYGHYIIKIRWKDGHISERHFPERGIPLKDLKEDRFIGIIPGEEAVKILEENAPLFTQEEFSWLDFRDKAVKMVHSTDKKQK